MSTKDEVKTIERRGMPFVPWDEVNHILGRPDGVPQQHPEHPGWYAVGADIAASNDGVRTTFDMTITYEVPRLESCEVG